MHNYSEIISCRKEEYTIMLGIVSTLLYKVQTETAYCISRFRMTYTVYT